MFEHLMQPINVGTMTLRNRMVQAPMGTNLGTADGTVTDSIINYYAARANGGIGMIIVEATTPELRGKCIPAQLEVSGIRFIPGLSRLANAVHAGGAKIALQLAHAGWFGSETITGMKPYTPSGVPTVLLPDDKPMEMTIDEIHELVQTYAMSALWARLAGFDAVEVHGAHSYMPQQFLSRYTNRRTDEYGGSLENRARFCLEVIRAIKETAGPDFNLIWRISAEEYLKDGLTLEETTQFAKWVEEAGADAIHVSAGCFDCKVEILRNVLAGKESPAGKKLSEGVSTVVWVPPMYVPRGNMVRLAEAIKKHVSIPVIAVCGISPELGEEVIASGKADLVAIGRQSIADPDWPNKVIAGKPEEIRRCIRCNECLGTAISYRSLGCAVNAVAGREEQPFVALVPVEKPRKVMIVGGGPGGMEAARVAALRGHKVTLYEKSKELGGMMRYSSVPEFKQDIRDFLQYQKHQLYECGVSVVTGTEVTTKLVQSEKPDVVIVASGARQSRPQIDGINDSGIYDAIDVLGGKIPQEKRVIVCGAGLIGVEVALYLAESHQKKVVLVDMLLTVAPEEMDFTQWVLQARLVEAEVDVRLNHCINRISPKSISCTLEGADKSIEGDAVVVAMGMTADQTLYNELMKLPIEVLAIGDTVKARKIIDAVHEGYHAGRRI